ncbi:MAG: putative lipid II flippase FtsW, partial [Verrucomicrobiae bacterium]|nr:putative lipid II flippase FtsW [Verrucomicrobiae bacterium]
MNNRLVSALLIFCVSILLGLGMVMLSSASIAKGGAIYFDMQLRWTGIGFIALILCAVVDYRRLKSKKIIITLCAVAALLLIAVLIPGIGMKIKETRRWINIGGFRLQPSEFAKLVTILALAFYCEYNARFMKKFIPGIVIPSLIIGFMAGLIMVGKDYGGTLLLGIVSLTILTIGGTRLIYLFLICIVSASLFAAAIWENENRRARLLAFMYPEKYAETLAWQNEQGKIALGAGGWSGRGLGDSRQKLGFMPEHHTDFILAVIGEELGLRATLLIVLLYTIMVFLGGVIAWRANDIFGLLIAAGITTLIGMQAFINIAVVTAVIPNKGLPLPFISYGGSNLVILMAG